MKNYYYNGGGNLYELQNNGEFPEVNRLSSGLNVDYSYRIVDDGFLHIKDRTGVVTTYEVRHNDIVLIMYSNTSDYKDRSVIIIHDDELSRYYDILDDLNKNRNKLSDNVACENCATCEKAY